MTLLVISPDYASHAMPLLTLADAWAAAGERVFVATGRAVLPLVERWGFEHRLLALAAGSNPGIARADEQPAGEDDNLRAFFAATRKGMIATLRYQAEARSHDLLWRPEQVASATLRLVDAVRPDAIVVDHLAFGATLGLRAGRVPYADVVLGHPRQLPVGDEVYGVPSAWPSAFQPGTADIEELSELANRVAVQFSDAYNSALMALEPTATPVADAFTAHGSIVLLNYPQLLHDPARTSRLPAGHAFLGHLARIEHAPDDIRRWLEAPDDRPLIVVSLGTFLSARVDVLAVLAAGLRGLDVRVALATGSADPRQIGPLPDHWLVRPHLPQVALLAHARALVTHAGNNSVTEALADGVPMFVLPFSTDQFDGAAAIEKAGLGTAADPNRLAPEIASRAVANLIAHPRRQLEELSSSLRALPGGRVGHAAVTEWAPNRL